MNIFLLDYDFALDFEGQWIFHAVQMCDERADIRLAVLHREYSEKGHLSKQVLRVTLKDRGSITPRFYRDILIVRRVSSFVKLPDAAGLLIAHVQPSGDPYSYYVFVAKAAPLPIHSRTEYTTSPAPPEAAPKAVPLDACPPCPCVISGTTHHEKGTSVVSEKHASTDLPDWFGSQDDAPASGA